MRTHLGNTHSMSDGAATGLATTTDARRGARETRSAWLRIVALAILVLNLAVAKHDNISVHANVVIGYGLATLMALVSALSRTGPLWLSSAFVVVDALLVVVLFYEHLFASGPTFDHSLTAPSLAVAFVLLTQVALQLRPQLVLLFAGLVVFGWLSFLAIAAGNHTSTGAAGGPNWVDFGLKDPLLQLLDSPRSSAIS